MSDEQTYLPNGKPVGIIFFWFVPFILAALLLIKEGISTENVIAAVFVIGIISLDIFPYQKPVSITISVNEKILQYRYCNCWNQIRLLTVDLSKTTTSFKYRLVTLNYRLLGRLKFRWRLLIYKGNYFHNRIIIKQDDEVGYSKAQLEDMFSLITQCKDGSS